MRGLPPPPAGVGLVTFAGDQEACPWQVSFWLLLPEAELAEYADFRDLTAQLEERFFDLLSTTCADVVFVRACRLQVWRMSSVVVVNSGAASQGLQGPSTPQSVNSIYRWLTDERGRGGRAVTRMPGVPSAWTTRSAFLKDAERASMEHAMAEFMFEVNAIHSGVLLSVTMGTLHRIRAGVPLPAGEFAPFTAVVCDHRLSRLSTRLRAAGFGSP